MERWEGRVALVTGASAGIGRCIVKSLVESGMVVIGSARRLGKLQDLEKELSGKKGKMIPMKCDLEKDEEVYNLFKIIQKEYGGLDVLVNNAAKIHPTGLLDGTPAIWRSMMDLNVIPVALCSQLAVKSMINRKVNDGHIIMISSDSAYKVHNYGWVRFYCATKFALGAYAEGLRQEVKELKSGIKVSTISPGAVNTEIWYFVTEDPSYRKELDAAAQIMLQPSDIAASVEYILSTSQTAAIHDISIQPTEDGNFSRTVQSTLVN